MIRIKNLKINKESEAIKKYEEALERSLSKLTPEEQEAVLKPTIKSPILLKALRDNKNPLMRIKNFILQ